MWVTNPNLMERARKEAEVMLKTGEKIRTVKFGDHMDVIFVTTELELVRGTDSLVIDGVEFYLGCKV